jgi:hypothetical protein
MNTQTQAPENNTGKARLRDNKQSKVLIHKVYWRVHTTNFLKEILENSVIDRHNAILEKPMNIFISVLAEVGKRASELNDKKLNALMCRLTLYEISNPESKEYNPKLVNKIIKEGMKIK